MIASPSHLQPDPASSNYAISKYDRYLHEKASANCEQEDKQVSDDARGPGEGLPQEDAHGTTRQEDRLTLPTGTRGIGT